MKPVPAIVEDELAREEAAVRAALSALREAEVQLGKKEKLFEAARAAADLRRLEVGRALIAIRARWPARGPNAKGWGEFCVREGIEQSTAWNYMKLSGYVGDEFSPTDGENFPTYAQAGIDKRPRRDDQPDLPDRAPPEPKAYALLAGFDLRLGRWQEALYQVGIVDALVTDPPFGAAVHTGSRALGNERADGSPLDGIGPDYEPWTPDDVMEFVAAWSPRTRGWMACMTSHDLIGAYQRAYEAVDRYPFAPVPIVMRGMSQRLSGDGPSSWAVYLMVARPRTADFAKWGTLPGAYVGGANPEASKGRGKPRWLLDEIVRDYSRHGDLVCDPLAGWGSTLIAALGLGRRAIGAEFNPQAHRAATSHARQPIPDDEQGE